MRLWCVVWSDGLLARPPWPGWICSVGRAQPQTACAGRLLSARWPRERGRSAHGDSSGGAAAMQIVKRSGVDRRSQLVLLERAFALIEEMKALKVLAGEGGRDVHCRCSASPMWDGMGWDGMGWDVRLLALGSKGNAEPGPRPAAMRQLGQQLQLP